MPHVNARLNKVGIPIMEPYRPAEEFYMVFDGFEYGARNGIRYRPATVPSRLKNT